MAILRWFCGFALLVSHSVFAASVPLSLPSNVGSTSGSFFTKGGASFSGAAFNSGLTTQVAGKAITVPATMRLAANAASFAVGAVRLTPGAFVAGAVATWLLGHGIQWAENQFVKSVETSNLVTDLGFCSSGGSGKTLAYCRSTAEATFAPPTYAFNAYVPKTGGFTIQMRNVNTGGLIAARTWDHTNGMSCPSGSSLSAGTPYCIGSTQSALVESDWDPVIAAPLPDVVASEMSSNGAAIRLTPEFATGPQIVPLSDPYIDPVTGKNWRDVAHITPSPTNPLVADLQVTKQELDSNGDPAIDPVTELEKPLEENDDACLEHPDRLGCKEWGETPDVPELQTSEKTISITPDTGWGSDTAACPADLAANFMGQPLALSFQPVCDGVDMFRPVVLAMAWITSILIAFGITKRGA